MKHSKDVTKTPFHLIPLDFIAAMAHTMKVGINDLRTCNDWMRLTWNDEVFDQYYSALLRHVRKASDPETDLIKASRHWAAVACNAMILWYHSKKGSEC